MNEINESDAIEAIKVALLRFGIRSAAVRTVETTQRTTENGAVSTQRFVDIAISFRVNKT